MVVADAEPAKEARRLIRSGIQAALATSFAGRPYVSLVATACDLDASPLLLLSDLAQHARNIAGDPRVSLLYANAEGLADPLAGARLTLLGSAERLDDPRAKARFTARHPSSAAYGHFADFRLYRVRVERGQLIAGFGRIAWIEREQLLLPEDAAPLANAEAEIIAQMNADPADAVAGYAEGLLRRPGSGWRLTGIDPEGCDLRRGNETARLEFAEPVLTPDAARRALLTLADRIRQGE